MPQPCPPRTSRG